MARSCSAMILAVILLTFSGVGAQAPSLAPAPSPDCSSVLIDNLSECLTYVESGSNQTKPDKGCCPGLSTVVDNVPQCLCALLAGGDTYGISVDRKKALGLPPVCHVSTPPVDLCSAFGYPVASPVGSPSAGPTSSGGPSTGIASPPKANGVTASFRVSAPVLLACLWVAITTIFF